MEITKRYCDKCKKEIKYYKSGIIIDLIKNNWFTEVEREAIHHVELCKSCEKSFKRWMKER